MRHALAHSDSQAGVTVMELRIVRRKFGDPFAGGRVENAKRAHAAKIPWTPLTMAAAPKKSCSSAASSRVSEFGR